MRPRNTGKLGDYSCDLGPDGTSGKDGSTQATVDDFDVKCYWAPEMVETDSSKQYLPSLDIWALGCILYQLATGKNVFQDSAAILLYTLNNDSPLQISLRKYLKGPAVALSLPSSWSC